MLKEDSRDFPGGRMVKSPPAKPETQRLGLDP